MLGPMKNSDIFTAVPVLKSDSVSLIYSIQERSGRPFSRLQDYEHSTER